MKLIPRQGGMKEEEEEKEAKKEIKGRGHPFAKKEKEKRRHDMKLFVNAECHFQQLSEHFISFSFWQATDWPGFECPKVGGKWKTREPSKRAPSLGLHFA